jgi:hypothetical protein
VNRRHAGTHVGDAIHFQLALEADSHPAKWPASLAADWIGAEAPNAPAHQDGGNGLPGKRTNIRAVDSDVAEIYGEPPAPGDALRSFFLTFGPSVARRVAQSMIYHETF